LGKNWADAGYSMLDTGYIKKGLPPYFIQYPETSIQYLFDATKPV